MGDNLDAPSLAGVDVPLSWRLEAPAPIRMASAEGEGGIAPGLGEGIETPLSEGNVGGGGHLEGQVESVATWYGEPYHGRFMACQPAERYDMNDPTITASTWYPCNTWLRVCHEGRCIEVVVRDTGLFSHAVDLSRAAFAELAPLGAGVISVTVEVMEVPE